MRMKNAWGLLLLPALLAGCGLFSPVRDEPDWRPENDLSWQIQLSVPPQADPLDVDLYDVDLYDTSAETVAAYKARGITMICYFSAGSWEDWRPDAGDFPPEVLGKDYVGWAGEKWLDIRNLEALEPIMRARLELCRDKGFDGADPDNMDSHTNDTGFPLTAEDQLRYNRFIADLAHSLGLQVGLKNDPEQAVELEPWFDFMVTEDCFDQGWCGLAQPFARAGKPVLMIEYTDLGAKVGEFCPAAQAWNYQALLKKRDLGEWRQPCW